MMHVYVPGRRCKTCSKKETAFYASSNKTHVSISMECYLCARKRMNEKNRKYRKNNYNMCIKKRREYEINKIAKQFKENYFMTEVV